MITAMPSVSAPATGAEDEKDLSKVNLDVSLFEAYTQAFLEARAAR